MKLLESISGFLTVAAEDPRIGPVHISLYVVLICLASREGAGGAIVVAPQRIMPIAKIRGRVCYRRAIRQLHECGYLIYQPSFNPDKPSTVILRPFEKG